MAQFIPWVIKSFRGGLSDEDNIGISGSFKYGHGLDIHKRRDSLTCKQAMKHAKRTNDLIKYFVVGSQGTTYAFGNGGTIWTRSPSGEWNEKYHDSNGEIMGAAEWTVSDGSTYVVWCSGSNVARKQIINTSSADNWANAVVNWQTDLTNCGYHPMKRASGALLIGNDRYLGAFFYDGSYSNDAMFIEPGHVIKCLESRDDRVIMGTQSKSGLEEEGHIWSWITEATNYIQKKKIPVLGVNALLYTELMLLQGGVDGELFYSDFTNSVPVGKLPADNYQCNPGGAVIDNDLAAWGMYGGVYPGIWTYGRRMKNRPNVLNYDYRLVPTVGGSTVTQIGAVTSVGGILIASWATLDGSTVVDYGINEVDTTTKATAVYESLEFDGGNPHLLKQFRDTHLLMTPMPIGTSVSVRYKADKASTWMDAKTPAGSTTYSVAGSTEAIFYIGKPAKILEISPTLTPSGNLTPEVLAVVTYVEKETDEYGK